MAIHGLTRWGHKLGLWAGLLLGLAQVGCAHPVVVEPSVVISSSMVYPPFYHRAPGPVVVPAPRPIYLPPPPPRVVYVPPVYAQPIDRFAPGWADGGHHGARDGHRRHGYGRGREHDREGWRR